MKNAWKRSIVAAGLAGLLLADVVSAKTAPSDSWITTKVKMQLLTAEDVSGTDVNVDTRDGLVTLQGPVSTAAEKARTVKLARGIEGVRDVRDLLEIVPQSKASVIEAKDDVIRDRLSKDLNDAARLQDSAIAIQSVTNGTVVLGGKAKTLGDHAEALRLARRTPGVRKVVSQIVSPDTLGDEDLWFPEVKAEKVAEAEAKDAQVAAKGASGQVSDSWITTKAKLALWTSPDITSDEINVDTRDGVVTLFGTVTPDAVREVAVQKVRAVDGVKDVKNQLQVVSVTTEKAVEHADDAIKSAVTSRLAERGDLNAAKIEVSVAKGVVQLKGTVASQEQRLTALSQARMVAGVRAVIDELHIQMK
ncbi:MAG: BON domain-containing protein [Deltaproteobacteria bacterium]|nr:BON domain-containing protein [Deltaproteobacteria bacterium]